MKNCGIYMILNIINLKMYVGSSNDLNKRKIEHYKQLRNNRHFNLHLQKSFNKYGESKFIFIILESNINKEELLKKEITYIIEKDSLNPLKGYNKSIPIINDKYHLSNDISNIIYQINIINGEVIQEFKSVACCARTLNCHEESIRRILRQQKNYKTYKGFSYILKEKYNEENKQLIINLNTKKNNIRMKKGYFKGNAVETYNLETNEVIKQYSNKKEMLLDYDTTEKYLSKVLTGEKLSFKGVGLRYMNKELSFELID